MKKFVSHLLSFDGCISRREWWLACGGWILFLATVSTIEGDHDLDWASLIVLFSLWPMLAFTVRRWHDRGRSGVWCLIVFVPIVGVFVALIELGLCGSEIHSPWREPRRSAFAPTVPTIGPGLQR